MFWKFVFRSLIPSSAQNTGEGETRTVDPVQNLHSIWQRRTTMAKKDEEAAEQFNLSRASCPSASMAAYYLASEKLGVRQPVCAKSEHTAMYVTAR